MSYKSLEIWKLSRQIALDIHRLSSSLPIHEKYELGSQIRRSSVSIRANIVEGYGRRRYIKEYIKFIVYAIGSKDETLDHLEMMYDLGYIKEKDQYCYLHKRLEKLGKMLNGFLQALDKCK